MVCLGRKKFFADSVYCRVLSCCVRMPSLYERSQLCKESISCDSRYWRVLDVNRWRKWLGTIN
jgi:hypothetical protein